MTMTRGLLIGMTIGICLLLSACKEESNDQKAKAAVAKMVNQLSTPIAITKPIEKKDTLPADSVKYTGEKYRDPFSPPTAVKNSKEYANTILRDIPLENLKLVGIIFHENDRWAIFRANNDKLYKLTEGMRIGYQGALLWKIEQKQVTFKIEMADTPETRNVVMMVPE